MAYIPNDAHWYLADLVIEHTIEDDPRNVVHVNMHLIEANSPEQAYQKALALGGESELAYTNTSGKQVKVVFRGLRDLNVIHDPLEDGAELAYSRQIAVPEPELLASLRSREELAVFTNAKRDRDIPNYMPESVMRMLEDEGFTRDEIEGGK